MSEHNPIKTILIIEDDRFISEMYIQSLRKAGYETEWVINGAEAERKALDKQYDLILLDIMLPEKQGTEILQFLRGEEDKVPHSRIFVLTNYDQDEESRVAMQSHADAYLIKADITPSKLIEIISKMPAKRGD